jgi:hypothetical protein
VIEKGEVITKLTLAEMGEGRGCSFEGAPSPPLRLCDGDPCFLAWIASKLVLPFGPNRFHGREKPNGSLTSSSSSQTGRPPTRRR